MANSNKIKKTERSLSDFERRLSANENNNDFSTLPDIYMILRLDAHRVGDWVVENSQDNEYPFCSSFQNSLVDAAHRLTMGPVVGCFAYIHGDEISLLFTANESSNPRKRSKLISTLSSYASLFVKNYSESSNIVFHSKLSELPSKEAVVEYFIWQRLVAVRNSVNSILIKGCGDDKSAAKEVVQTLNSLTVLERTRYLEDMGVDYWSLDPFINTGTYLVRDPGSLEGQIKRLVGFEGPATLDPESFASRLSPVLEDSLAFSAPAISDKDILSSPTTGREGLGTVSLSKFENSGAKKVNSNSKPTHAESRGSKNKPNPSGRFRVSGSQRSKKTNS